MIVNIELEKDGCAGESCCPLVQLCQDNSTLMCWDIKIIDRMGFDSHLGVSLNRFVAKSQSLRIEVDQSEVYAVHILSRIC